MFDAYPGDFLTPDQIAESLGVTPTTVYNLLRKGEIPASKFGGMWRISKDELRRKLLGKKSRTRKTSAVSKRNVAMDDVINAFVNG